MSAAGTRSALGKTRIMTTGSLIAALFAIVAFEGCENGWSQPARHTERHSLPAPQRDDGASLAQVLATRHSVREFGRRDLDDAELAQLLWAAQGVTDGHRAAPSAGALYPITVRVVDAHGVWRYIPAEHALIHESAVPRRDALASASYGQDAVHDAPVTLVISADVAITARKYGARAERYATLEAGHVAQNVLLTATALDLAALPIGAFDDGAVRRALELPAREAPLYLIPVGALPRSR